MVMMVLIVMVMIRMMRIMMMDSGGDGDDDDDDDIARPRYLYRQTDINIWPSGDIFIAKQMVPPYAYGETGIIISHEYMLATALIYRWAPATHHKRTICR